MRAVEESGWMVLSTTQDKFHPTKVHPAQSWIGHCLTVGLNEASEVSRNARRPEPVVDELWTHLNTRTTALQTKVPDFSDTPEWAAAWLLTCWCDFTTSDDDDEPKDEDDDQPKDDKDKDKDNGDDDDYTYDYSDEDDDEKKSKPSKDDQGEKDKDNKDNKEKKDRRDKGNRDKEKGEKRKSQDEDDDNYDKENEDARQHLTPLHCNRPTPEPDTGTKVPD